MSNPEIADLIANALQDGIIHPGDPARGLKPRPLVLPFKPRPGMPDEMTDLMNETTRQLAEAIVHLIETEGDVELVPRAEVRELRMVSGEVDLSKSRLPVYCRCDKDTPLMVLSVRDPEHVVIDGSALLRQLHNRQVAHPHKAVVE